MSQLDDFLERRKSLDQLTEWLVRNSYWTVQEVADYLSVSEGTVKDLPPEVLPVIDVTPQSKRTTRRYAPTDVFALRAFLAEYGKAAEEGEAAKEEWLAKRRQTLQQRHNELKKLAREAA